MKLLVPALALLAVGQSANDHEIVSRSFDQRGFHAVDNAGPYEVTVRRGAAFSISASGPRVIIDRMAVSVEDGTLKLGFRSEDERKRYWSKDLPRTQIAVTLPTIDGAILSGAGKLDVDRIDGQEAKLMLSGRGQLIVGNVTASQLSLALRGAGKIRTDGGRADRLTATLAGAGNVDTLGLAARDAKLHLAGVGNIDVRASGRAEIRTGGMGNAKVVGTTDCTISTHGMGQARCVDE